MPGTPIDLGLRDLPLLRFVLNFIDTHPEQWNQREWGSVRKQGEDWGGGAKEDTVVEAGICGTYACIAGWASTFCGEPPLVTKMSVTTPRTIHFKNIAVYAQEVLGLTDAEADALFSGGNNREAVQRAAEEIAEARGEKL